MNFKKVNNYLQAKAEEYRKYYPVELFEGLEMSASSGSFGACLISLKNNYFSFDSVYVGNYSAIDRKISEFFTRSSDRIASKAYEEQQKENKKGLYCKLEIFNDSQKVNEIEFTTAQTVKSELIKILIADKRRGVKTTYKPKPYSNDMTIIQKWDKESAHLSHNVNIFTALKI